MSKKCAARIHFWSHERNVETWTGWQALRSTGASVTQSQEDAYEAMAMQDTLCSPFSLDSTRPTLVLSDVRDGMPLLKQRETCLILLPLFRHLQGAPSMLHRDLIMSNQLIHPMVDNRMPADVPHWPAFAAWWASRRCLVGPQEEATDILWGWQRVSCMHSTSHSLTMTVYQSRFSKCSNWRISSTSGLT